MAAAILRDLVSWPYSKIRSASSFSGSSLTRSAAVGARIAHPHVERSVLPVAEAALRTIELHRGDPEVEEHTVDRTVDDLLIDLGETGADGVEALAEDREPLPRHCEGGGVAIDADEPAYTGGEQRFRVTAGAERHVDHRPPAPEEPDHLADHDRVVRRVRHPSPDVAGEDADADGREQGECGHDDEREALSDLGTELVRRHVSLLGSRSPA